MKSEYEPKLRPRMQQAIEELKRLVLEHYPDATFRVERNPDEWGAIDLMTMVDLEDTGEVLDYVIDRVLALQLDEGLNVHVIPVRPRARVLANLKAEQEHKAKRDLSHAQP